MNRPHSKRFAWLVAALVMARQRLDCVRLSAAFALHRDWRAGPRATMRRDAHSGVEVHEAQHHSGFGARSRSVKFLCNLTAVFPVQGVEGIRVDATSLKRKHNPRAISAWKERSNK